MKLSQIVQNIDKTILNVKNFNMTLYFHNGAIFYVFLFFSTLARYCGSEFDAYKKTAIYLFFIPTTFQNIETELKNVF